MIMDQDAGRGGCAKVCLEETSTRSADSLDVTCERKGGPKDESQMLALTIWKGPLAEMVKREKNTFQKEKWSKSLSFWLNFLIRMSPLDMGAGMSREKLGPSDV